VKGHAVSRTFRLNCARCKEAEARVSSAFDENGRRLVFVETKVNGWSSTSRDHLPTRWLSSFSHQPFKWRADNK